MCVLGRGERIKQIFDDQMGVTEAKTMLYVHQTDPFIFLPGHRGQHPSQLIGPLN